MRIVCRPRLNLGFHHTSTTMSLVLLPAELLFQIVNDFSDVKDLYHLSTTCKSIWEKLSDVPSKVTTRLIFVSSTIFSPPLIVLAYAASRLSKWANESDTHSSRLQEAYRLGIGALEKLASHYCRLNMQDLKTIYSISKTILPLIQQLQAFLKVETEELFEVPDAGQDLMLICLYGSLFADAFESVLHQTAVPSHCSVEARMDFIKYCLRDENCWMTRSRPTDAPRGVDGRLHPFCVAHYPVSFLDADRTPEPQIEIYYILDQPDSFWNTSWAKVLGDLPQEPWKRRFWADLVMYQGLQGLEMICGNPESFSQRLKEWRSKIETLQCPPVTVVGTRRLKVWVFPFPSLHRDLSVTLFGHWNTQSIEYF
jgi:hypothetical protein